MPNFAKIDKLKGNRMIGPIQSDRKVQAASRHPTGCKARLVRASVLFRLSRDQDRNGLRNDGAREQQRRSLRQAQTKAIKQGRPTTGFTLSRVEG